MIIELHLHDGEDNLPISINPDMVECIQPSVMYDGGAVINTPWANFEIVESYEQVLKMLMPLPGAEHLTVMSNAYVNGYRDGYQHRIEEERNESRYKNENG